MAVTRQQEALTRRPYELSVMRAVSPIKRRPVRRTTETVNAVQPAQPAQPAIPTQSIQSVIPQEQPVDESTVNFSLPTIPNINNGRTTNEGALQEQALQDIVAQREREYYLTPREKAQELGEFGLDILTSLQPIDAIKDTFSNIKEGNFPKTALSIARTVSPLIGVANMPLNVVDAVIDNIKRNQNTYDFSKENISSNKGTGTSTAGAGRGEGYQGRGGGTEQDGSQFTGVGLNNAYNEGAGSWDTKSSPSTQSSFGNNVNTQSITNALNSMLGGNYKSQIQSGKSSTSKSNSNGWNKTGSGDSDYSFSSDSGDSGGGGTVLCTELYRQKVIPEEQYKDSQYYGNILNKEQNEVVIGYHKWAKPCVKAMQKSKIISYMFKPIVNAWGRYSSYKLGKLNKIGIGTKITVKILFYISKYIGKYIKRAELKKMKVVSV